MQILSTDELPKWRNWYRMLPDAGPYHAPDYIAELVGNFEYDSEWAELAIFGDESGFVYYPYIRRPLTDLSFASETLSNHTDLSDIVSSWYYGGPLLSPDADEDLASEFTQEFNRYCHSENIVAEFIRFDPTTRNHANFSSLEPIHNRQTVPVDLTQSKDDIWEGYEGRNQRAIKQARESKLEVDTTYTNDDIEQFHNIYTNAMEARDADEHYRFSLTFFQRLLELPLFSLVVARYEQEIVGGFLIAHDETTAHHFLSASNPEYWDYRVNNLMYHEAVMYMYESGCELFDFQGGRPGVFKFKKGFSPDRGEFYIGKRIHNSTLYDELVVEADKAGIDTDSGYFPAYRPEQSN